MDPLDIRRINETNRILLELIKHIDYMDFIQTGQFKNIIEGTFKKDIFVHDYNERSIVKKIIITVNTSYPKICHAVETVFIDSNNNILFLSENNIFWYPLRHINFLEKDSIKTIINRIETNYKYCTKNIYTGLWLYKATENKNTANNKNIVYYLSKDVAKITFKFL